MVLQVADLLFELGSFRLRLGDSRFQILDVGFEGRQFVAFLFVLFEDGLGLGERLLGGGLLVLDVLDLVLQIGFLRFQTVQALVKLFLLFLLNLLVEL